MTTELRECLELQLLEMEMLFSMFPSKEEIVLQDKNSVLYVQRYLEGILESLPPSIAFSIFVKAEDSLIKAEMHVSLPQNYPQKEPQLFVRSSVLDRQQQNLVNKSLAAHIRSLDRGELCITSAVQWLQDNISTYIQCSKQQTEPENDRKESTATFYRMWIYSHHIYRQELRKKILECAKRLNLTGFCLTGKPGVICVEGLKEHCEEFWRDIRYPNWKHISCKHTDSKEVTGKIDDLCLFQSFEELKFEAHGDYGLRNDYHMDLGQFFEYLREHNSEHIFQILFGIEGKS
ncbi:RWD domain-containing protein 2A [Bombina bombina]|uniref:RWD domain-containing protein 2A n=1 Tax=Bombina bombina TaxID=8345 RepID=UPI00235B2B5A|nr:RWD domain-containing protein 2A [Bombina bombina]XP_053566459.1 RWD domain-containing protein 2A [Bombina bombina]XP_053566460.1 RWD domain-containing protein 2A [Bombina bombina]